jgi:hypothetical protein
MRILIFLMLVLIVKANAQQAEPITFKETIRDFGKIREDGGNAEHDFTFVNTSSQPVTILKVTASCGCTTPGWTNEPVLPGKTGFVKGSFNPSGRPGYFNKSLTVTTSAGGNPITLSLKGTVTNEEVDSDVSRLKIASGNFMLRAKEINFGKIYINRPATSQEFIVFNSGQQPIQISSVRSPAYINVVHPDTIAANQQAVLKVTYNAMLKNQYGFVSDNIELVTDDEALPLKSLPVYATIEEFFLPVSSAEQDRVPVMALPSAAMEFGNIREGASLQKEITFRNGGRKELIIRAIQPNCRCLSVNASETKIAPGKEGKITITWKAEGKKGAQHKAITIYSTDPVNPVQRVALTASVL